MELLKWEILMEINKSLEELGILLPRVLLPGDQIDMNKWAVVACDQYSSEPEYWDRVRKYTSGSPSTLEMVYPECFLGEENPEERIGNIQSAMERHLKEGLFRELEPGIMLVERTTRFSPPRHGIVLALDLEKYDYSKESTSLIRATEGTIVERIPPRKRIRQGSPLEFPHIMVLIDDREKKVVEPLFENKAAFKKIYDFSLMMESGAVRGYHVSDHDAISSFLEGLSALANPEAFAKRYGAGDVLLYAMGDGNHSLATAKSIWEEVKSDGGENVMNHPARYAMVELLNIYDEGLIFKPIHRVLFRLDPQNLLSQLRKEEGIEIEEGVPVEKLPEIVETAAPCHKIGFFTEATSGIIYFTRPEAVLPAGSIQKFLDKYLKTNPETVIDYIHGTESTLKLGKQEDSIGFFLPKVDKGAFFETVIRDGALPRKTFSMGEAEEKRFYIEARRIAE